MCGIHAVISRDGASLTDTLKSCLISRGPDHFGQEHDETLCEEGAPVFLTLTSTVLSLRGDHVTPQPFRNPSTGSIFCWNGEAWKLDEKPVDGNDGEAVFKLLTAAPTEDAVLNILRSIRGPFAFVYYDAPLAKLYYGRDRLGRRSLLVNRDEGLVLSSVAHSTTSSWSEVEADGIYVLDLKRWSASTPSPPVSRKPWSLEESDDLVSLCICASSSFLATYNYRSSTLRASTCPRQMLRPHHSLPPRPSKNFVASLSARCSCAC